MPFPNNQESELMFACQHCDGLETLIIIAGAAAEWVGLQTL
jgi:hypothetical protein